MTLLERALFSEDKDFIRRVQMAGMRAATTVLQADPPNQTSVALARYFLRDPAQVATRLAFVVASSNTVTAEITDAELEALILQRWPMFAALG